MRTFEVHALGVGRDYVCSHISGDLEELVVVGNGIFEIDRCIFKLFRLGVVALLELDYPLHKGMMQVELEFRMIAIIVCHKLLVVLLVVLDELWNHLFHRTDYDIVSYLVDRSVRIGVDGDDDA